MKADLFQRLNGCVMSQWIDKSAQTEGIFKWKESVLKAVGKGHSPGGEMIWVEILVCSQGFLLAMTRAHREI